MYQRLVLIAALALVTAAALCASGAETGEGKLVIWVKPDQAYVFVDGKPSGEGNQLIRLSPGTHTIAVHNYGYTAQSREVSIQSGKNPDVEFELERVAKREVLAPRGRIQIEGAPRAAVFLNGKSLGYFVGHADEFNNNFMAWQQLVVPPGTYQLTLVDKNKEIWSGPVTVPQNKRVIVNVAKGGEQKVKDWNEGQENKAFPRFKSNFVGETVVAVAPVSGQFRAEQAKINCGESSRLLWSSDETVEAIIADGVSGPKSLPPSGELTVQPKATTDYKFQALGPGGIVNSDATVEVNKEVQAQLEVSPTEVRYRRIGEKVIQPGSVTLKWKTANADSVKIEPVGAVAAQGIQTLSVTPKQSSDGSVAEDVTYTVVAKNECGGSETHTATVHMTGSIEPVPNSRITSVFFPTGYPGGRHPEIGLVRSQQMMLLKAAEAFKAYLEYDPDAKLQIIGHTDERDPDTRNQALSERRVAAVQRSLIAAGVAGDKIEIIARGETEPLSVETVQSVEKENPTKAPKSDWQSIVWAYNRRVDLVLLPKGAEPVSSIRLYPHDALEAPLLRNSEWQKLGAVEKAQEEAPRQGTISTNQKPGGRP